MKTLGHHASGSLTVGSAGKSSHSSPSLALNSCTVSDSFTVPFDKSRAPGSSSAPVPPVRGFFHSTSAQPKQVFSGCGGSSSSMRSLHGMRQCYSEAERRSHSPDLMSRDAAVRSRSLSPGTPSVYTASPRLSRGSFVARSVSPNFSMPRSHAKMLPRGERQSLRPRHARSPPVTTNGQVPDRRSVHLVQSRPALLRIRPPSPGLQHLVPQEISADPVLSPGHRSPGHRSLHSGRQTQRFTTDELKTKIDDLTAAHRRQEQYLHDSAERNRKQHSALIDQRAKTMEFALTQQFREQVMRLTQAAHAWRAELEKQSVGKTLEYQQRKVEETFQVMQAEIHREYLDEQFKIASEIEALTAQRASYESPLLECRPRLKFEPS